ncbi:competence type IV pilus minor pilin ComGD [Aquibacillus salsiterrae]|uniref:Type II secretion system GspH family protein n=1 Tax=Aquibacillus salsiterrae TaxID=2950439 RepID=A0A9X4ADP6_9BACI|nr:competence type IV pilus minor pilin ComGD [Aquibacillus salsiterrae]MDC3415509.1 type II secretion system GspH family protein [Aquibacillus salsiterrae]
MLLHNHKQAGFTMIELVIVLSIFSVMLSIFGLFQHQLIGKYQTEHALSLLQDDILLLQKRSIVKNENIQMYIYPQTKTYEIKQGGLGKILITRQLPTDWEIQLNTLAMPIAFTTNGTIKNPGVMTIKAANKSYKLYFPFGKGRCYVVEV